MDLILKRSPTEDNRRRGCILLAIDLSGCLRYFASVTTTYREAGVDIEAGDQFVEDITTMVQTTERPEVVGSIGGFSGLFSLKPGRFKDPLLVASTDGVGTKLKVATLVGRHSTVGIDLVAMCVNDIVVTGAEPLFFLDYFATAHLDLKQGREVIAGIAEGCRQAGCALLGGETAEMPGFYQPGDYDLAGFAVGVVERKRLLGSQRVRAGDVLLGLASNGLHSNGFSLVRKVLIEPNLHDLKSVPAGLSLTLGEELLRPTRIYVRPILELIQRAEVHALAHITGGGIPGNLPRVLPTHLAALVKKNGWPVPAIFKLVQQAGEVDDHEMLQTFNLGVGMIAVVAPGSIDRALQVVSKHGITGWPIGQVVERENGGDQFTFAPTA